MTGLVRHATVQQTWYILRSTNAPRYSAVRYTDARSPLEDIAMALGNCVLPFPAVIAKRRRCLQGRHCHMPAHLADLILGTAPRTSRSVAVRSVSQAV
ncbi:hypothetical protein GLOTRDRAFT_101828 [Gloeophyllum trabeum ATCC 11539]|uniref:Uncharacterized protein n=1 Tax=Gloeophyllum trabeum (strain ATCC 11539 / FP-39264 / Madison 617) TaxID=670483 RepID=S7PS27_GLOTA|nr:uncharacterized protein GLOTRDRAFT_101828 [Gloeophyllum trabeum ATCC 11539]EPQ50198.1 hypothetical protein GLOTRDRAFT_101828 [Gloeophyllum trabeum ATCC 11539]